MRIVFEGADLVGKSTIATAVAKALNLPYRGKITRKGPDQIAEAQLEDFASHQEAVLDRCYWMTNIIYEPITNHAVSALSAGVIVQRFLEDDNTLYVVITAEDETLKTRMAERGDEQRTMDEILKANNAYKQFIEIKRPKHLIHYTTDSCTAEESVQTVLALIRGYLHMDELVQKPKTAKTTKEAK